MPGDRFNKQDTKHIAEGRYAEVSENRAIYGSRDGQMPIFLRMVIIDVISDPATLTKAKLSHYEHDLKVANISLAAVAPRNSIIARRVMGGDSAASEKVMVLFPFFPPHMAMPAKPGEHVWAMFEHPDAKQNDLGYWFCKIVQPNFVEDVNYTHADRQFDRSFLPGLTDVFEGTDDPKYEFRNGAVDEKDGSRYSIPGTASLPDDEKAYEKLLVETDASKITKYESIPRYRKRPADVAFEGSNNTLIVLGTDRTGPVAEYDDDADKGKVPKPVSDDISDEGAGAIDLVAGRGQTPDTAGKPEPNSVGKEIGKSKKDLSEKEGDVDFKNDRSRVLIAQKTKADVNFKLDAVLLKHSGFLGTPGVVGPPPPGPPDPEMLKPSATGAIVIKTDKLRLVARQDVVILVTGAKSTDENGNVKDVDPSPDMCASIIIRTNGDIIFTPAITGVVKLGGDDANKAVLCTTLNNLGVGGQVIGVPIIDSFAGQAGADSAYGPLNGTFATKVLLK